MVISRSGGRTTGTQELRNITRAGIIQREIQQKERQRQDVLNRQQQQQKQLQEAQRTGGTVKIKGKEYKQSDINIALEQIENKLQGKRATFQTPSGFNDEAADAFRQILASNPQLRRDLSSVAGAKIKAKELGFDSLKEYSSLKGFAKKDTKGLGLTPGGMSVDPSKISKASDAKDRLFSGVESTIDRSIRKSFESGDINQALKNLSIKASSQKMSIDKSKINKVNEKRISDLLKITPSDNINEAINKNIRSFQKDPIKFIKEKGTKAAEAIFEVVNLPSSAISKAKEDIQKIKASIGEQEQFGGKPFSELLPFEQKGTAVITDIKFLSDEDLVKTYPFGATEEILRSKQSEVDIKSQEIINKYAEKYSGKYQDKINNEINDLIASLRDEVNNGKISESKAQEKFERKNKLILNEIQKEYEKEIKKESENDLDKLSSEAKEYVDKLSKSAMTEQALALVPINIATGAGLAIVGGVPVLRKVVATALKTAAVIKSPSIIRSFKQAPLASSIELGSFILGGGLVTLGKSGLKVDVKKMNKTFNKKLKVALKSQKKLLRDKRGSTFLEAARILKKKKKIKKKIPRNEAIKKFKKKYKNERINLIEKAVNNKIRENGSITKQELNNLRNFLKEAGLDKFQIDTYLAEIYRRQAIRILRQDLKTGLITKNEFGGQLTKLKNLKGQLNKRLRQYNIQKSQREILVPKKEVKLKDISKSGSPIQEQLTSSKLSSRQLPSLTMSDKLSAGLSLGQKYKNAQLSRGGQNFKQLNLQISNLSSKIKQETNQLEKSRLQSRLKTLTQQKQKDLQKTKTKQISLLKTPQLSLTSSQLKSTTTIETKLKSPDIKQPIKKPVPKKFPTSDPISKKRKIRLKSTLGSKRVGYNTLVKSRGKFLKVNDVPLTLKQAQSLGSWLADTSTARTFKTSISTKTPRKSKLNIPKDYYSKNLRKFRKPIRKGKPLKDSPLNIEKSSYLIDTPSEKKQLSLAKARSELFRKSKIKRTLKGIGGGDIKLKSTKSIKRKK